MGSQSRDLLARHNCQLGFQKQNKINTETETGRHGSSDGWDTSTTSHAAHGLEQSLIVCDKERGTKGDQGRQAVESGWKSGTDV